MTNPDIAKLRTALEEQLQWHLGQPFQYRHEEQIMAINEVLKATVSTPSQAAQHGNTDAAPLPDAAKEVVDHAAAIRSLATRLATMRSEDTGQGRVKFIEWRDGCIAELLNLARSHAALVAEAERLNADKIEWMRLFDGHVYVKNEEWAAKCEAERRVGELQSERQRVKQLEGAIRDAMAYIDNSERINAKDVLQEALGADNAN